MVDLIQIRRVVIICDTAIEQLVLKHIIQAGAKGYNCIYCFGKGRHEEIEDPLSGHSRVRIEVLAKPPVAESILDYVHHRQFESYPITAFMDSVDVDARDTYF